MDLVLDVITAAKSCFKIDGHLQNLANDPAFGELIDSNFMSSKINRFSDQTYRPGETAGLYAKTLVVPVFDNDGWSGILAAHPANSNLAYSLPFPCLMGPVVASSPCSIDRYSYPSSLDSDPGQGLRCQLKSMGSVVLGRNEFWAPSPNAPAYRLSHQAADTVYFRISGPPHGAYTHAFDAETLEYRYSGFSHADVTCRDILARLALETAEAGYLSAFDEAEAASVAEMFETIICSKTTAPTSAWNLVQALHSLSPERTMAHVRNLAASAGPLRDVARRTLELQA